MAYSRGENVRNPDGVVRAENIATDVLFGLRYPELPRHVVEEEHIIRGNDPSFRPATTEKKEFLLARENTEGGGVGGGGGEGGGRRRCTLRVDEGVVATGAQAKKQHESGG